MELVNNTKSCFFLTDQTFDKYVQKVKRERESTQITLGVRL